MAALFRTAAVVLHWYQLTCCVMLPGSGDACTRWCAMAGAEQEAPIGCDQSMVGLTAMTPTLGWSVGRSVIGELFFGRVRSCGPWWA